MDDGLVGTGNSAGGRGGGIYAGGIADVVVAGDAWIPAEAGTPPVGSVRVASNKAAGDGGGVALVDSAVLTGEHLVVHRNTSEALGGGLYLEGGNALAFAVADLGTTVVNDNDAVKGGGVAVVADAQFNLHGWNGSGADCSAAVGVVLADRYCAEVSLNTATSVAAITGEGGGLYVAGHGVATTDQVAFTDNAASVDGAAILVRDGVGDGNPVSSVVDLENTLVETNSDTDATHTVSVTSNARLDARFTTFAGNLLTVQFDANTQGTIDHSAISFPTLGGGGLGLDIVGGAGVTGTCTVGHNATKLGLLANNEEVDPLFVTTARGRWRLSTDPLAPSPALDQCEEVLPVDLDDNVRPQCPLHDAGAFEMPCVPDDDDDDDTGKW